MSATWLTWRKKALTKAGGGQGDLSALSIRIWEEQIE